MRDFVLTSESVTRGHPDKLCDQVSDAIVDACLSADPAVPVVAECAMASGIVFLSVRTKGDAPADFAAVARRVVADAGYEAGGRMTVMLDLVSGGAGSRADGAEQMTTAFGHACTHTPEGLAYPLWAAHRLTRALDRLRAMPGFGWLSPDAQAQVAVRFEARRPVGITGIALTCGVSAAVPGDAAERLRTAALGALAGAPVPPGPDLRFAFVHGAGAGGPREHSGQTGRKTAADSYGAYSRQSTSALSGKDPSRIDRTAAYAARQAALAVVRQRLAEECEVQLSYIAGQEAPAGVEVDTFGSGRLPDERIAEGLAKELDFRPGAIAERLGLWDLPRLRGGRFYRDLASYGQMGRVDLDAPWERTDDVPPLA